jgi:hypothetical protein
MVVVPIPVAATSPDKDTVATASLDDSQLTLVLVASVGKMEASSCFVPEILNVIAVGSTVTSVTEMVLSGSSLSPESLAQEINNTNMEKNSNKFLMVLLFFV